MILSLIVLALVVLIYLFLEAISTPINYSDGEQPDEPITDN